MLATPDLPGTSTRVAAEWGVAVVAGGQHVGFGTRNELTGLGGGAYLEIVGPDESQPAPPRPRPFGVDELAAARLVAWCARPARPLSEVRGELERAGFDPGPATSMSRQRPDGVLLEWSLTIPHLEAPHFGVMPFLIDWQRSEHPTVSLPNEAALVTLHLSHPDPGALTRALWVIGVDDRIEVTAGEPGLTATIDTPRGTVAL